MFYIEMRTKALMPGWQQMFARIQRRRLDEIDHYRRCQYVHAARADARRRMFFADNEFGGSDKAWCDAGEIDG